jgi:predicted Zn-dependent protease
MKALKIVAQAALGVVLFFGIWYSLEKVDWMGVFRVEKAVDQTEEKLGDLFWEMFDKSENGYVNPVVVSAVDSMVTTICQSNTLNREHIKVHVVRKDDINAFALPNGHLVVYSGLITASQNPQELAGVICHEIAHIQMNHVMKKLVKEIGLSVLIAMASGNGGAEVMLEASKLLSSSAFDRSLEKEADIKAVEYLIAAKLNPRPFADFLYKLSDDSNESEQYYSWMSTHPDSKERAAYIIEACQDDKTIYQSALHDSTWTEVKKALEVPES